MAYLKTQWQDHVVDTNKIDPATGKPKVIQEGTPVSAGNLNKIEKGIEDAHKQMEQAAKETVSLPYGLSVLNSPNGSPLDIQIEGRTLVSMANSDLEGGKKYVLADPKTAVVVDGTTYKGISKLEGKNARPTIIRTANFEGKVAGSTLENPHIFKRGDGASLNVPNGTSWTENDGTMYSQISSLDGTSFVKLGNLNSLMSQTLFSFNVIEEIERKVGKIPGTTVADKANWVRNNANKLTFNWHGYGSSVGGNKALLKLWNKSSSTWNLNLSHTASTTSKLSVEISTVDLSSYLDSDGFVHFSAYAEASDGVTASRINTDYAELQIELKTNADFYAPRVPLYEVPQESYDKILVEWDAAAVASRYPMVEGVKSLQNPYVMAEGENLLSPFTDVRYMHPNARATAAYEAVLDATDKNQHIYWVLDVIPGQQYTFSYEVNGEQQSTSVYEWIGSQGAVITNAAKTNPKTFTIPSNCKQIVVFMSSYGAGSITYKNPMLTLGSVVKPFKPRNPSYLYAETILRGLNSVNDLLYQDDGRWKMLKKWEEALVDGALSWIYFGDSVGYKTFYTSSFPAAKDRSGIVTRNNGSLIQQSNTIVNLNQQNGIGAGNLFLSFADYDTGFNETYTPTNDEIKAYFNGWKVKTVDGSNKPTAWISVIDGKDAPTQTLDYVKTNKAPDYTGYRLLYQLATPRVVDITDKAEGSSSVSGQTQVLLDSGVVVREKVIPVLASDNYYYVNGSTAPLSRKVKKILAVYKGQVQDDFQVNNQFVANVGTVGNEYARKPQESFDPAASYYVTYLVMDKEKFTTNPVNVKASYNTSIRSTVDQMNEQLADVKSMASIHDRYLYKLLLAAKANGWSV